MFGRQTVQTESKMKQNEFMERLQYQMLEAKRADIYKELEEINLRLFGWNRTLNVGEEFFEAKMEN